ncbi:MAG: sulfatase [Bacteroidales bacterium]
MNRKFNLLCLSVAGVSSLTGCATEKKEEKKPNIIIMMADDHTRQAMSCYGSKLVDTPNLDRLAKEGMLFNNCYVANSISGPSRACIITGKFSHKNGFTDNGKVFNGDQQTYPKLLQNAGYETAVIGKWHLSSLPQGFDHYEILIGQGDYFNSTFIVDGEKTPSEGYVTDVITDKTINWLDSRADKEKPFALMYYHKAPHRNWLPAPRHMGMFNDKVFPEPANLFDDYETRGRAAREQEMELDRHFREGWDLKLVTGDQLATDDPQLIYAKANEENVGPWKARQWDAKSYQSAYNRMSEEEKAIWNKSLEGRHKEYENNEMSHEELVRWKYQQYMRDYCATVVAMDENVGRLLDHLEETGELDNTIIIYTSDQGFYLGEHGWFDKRFMYEESYSTPLLVRYPAKIKAGTQTSALAMNVDFAPTFLDYAGVPIPEDIQGVSLRPVLESTNGEKPADWRDAVYYHFYEYPSEHAVKRQVGVRTDRYKLIHFYNDIDEWELYDMAQDPQEMKNLYNDPASQEIAAHMKKKLLELQEQYEDLDEGYTGETQAAL